MFDQVNGGLTERRAVGFQTRYSMPGRSAMVLADYDIAFRQLNSVTLIGNLARGATLDPRLRCGSSSQPAAGAQQCADRSERTGSATLETEFTPSQIRQLALDRTATSDTLMVSARHPLGERWQFMGDVSALPLGGTPASGGVDATPSTGLDKNVTVQLAGSNLLQASDLHIFGVRYDDSPSARSTTLSWDGRFVLRGAWRVGPRLASSG